MKSIRLTAKLSNRSTFWHIGIERAIAKQLKKICGPSAHICMGGLVCFITDKSHRRFMNSFPWRKMNRIATGTGQGRAEIVEVAQ